jgi:membrane-bound metal-dependent hydrolase YbcI (DUF457 family)
VAGFTTHIGSSTLLGIGYAAAGHLQYELPLPTCLLAGGLCSLGGILPDVDSDSGVPVRETLAFASAVTPLLVFERFRQMGLSNDSIVLACGLTYIIIRFGVGGLLKQYTVHRGMWHSLPAAAIAGLLVFLVSFGQDMEIRLFKTGAMLLGYVSHLLLDELYSLDMRKGVPRLKRSAGTALKLWGSSTWGNVSAYGKLVVLVGLVLNELGVIGEKPFHLPRTARTPQTAPSDMR